MPFSFGASKNGGQGLGLGQSKATGGGSNAFGSAPKPTGGGWMGAGAKSAFPASKFGASKQSEQEVLSTLLLKLKLQEYGAQLEKYCKASCGGDQAATLTHLGRELSLQELKFKVGIESWGHRLLIRNAAAEATQSAATAASTAAPAPAPEPASKPSAGNMAIALEKGKLQAEIAKTRSTHGSWKSVIGHQSASKEHLQGSLKGLEDRIAALEAKLAALNASHPGVAPFVEAVAAAKGAAPVDKDTFNIRGVNGARELVADKARARQLFAPILGGDTHFTTVSIGTNSFGPESATVVADALRMLGNLAVARIDDCIAGRMEAQALQSLKIICDALNGKKLVEVDLSDNALGKNGVMACRTALQSVETLERVMFKNNGLAPEAGDLISTLLLAKGPTKLTKLHVYNNMLGDAGAISFVSLIEQSPRLNDLMFATTRVMADGGWALATVLQGVSNLTSLNLSDNTFGSKAGVQLGMAMRNKPLLVKLVLRDTGIEDDGVMAVCESLVLPGNAPQLAELDLSGNDLTEEAAPSIGRVLAMRPLQVVLLEDNELEDPGAVVIAEVFAAVAAEVGRKEPCLRNLLLDSNMITAEGAVAITRCLIDAGESTLETLSLNHNCISDAGGAELSSLLESAGLGDSLGSMSDQEDDDEE